MLVALWSRRVSRMDGLFPRGGAARSCSAGGQWGQRTAPARPTGEAPQLEEAG